MDFACISMKYFFFLRFPPTQTVASLVFGRIYSKLIYSKFNYSISEKVSAEFQTHYMYVYNYYIPQINFYITITDTQLSFNYL